MERAPGPPQSTAVSLTGPGLFADMWENIGESGDVEGGHQSLPNPFEQSQQQLRDYGAWEREYAGYHPPAMQFPQVGAHISPHLFAVAGAGIGDAASSRRDSVAYAALQQWALPQIISLMWENMNTDHTVVVSCCRVLHSRIWPSGATEPVEAVVAEIHQHGGFDCVMTALKRHVLVKSVVAHCLKLLKDMRRVVEQTQQMAVQYHGADLVLDAVHCHPSSERVQALGCATIGMLAWKNKETAQHIIDLGGVETVLAAMTGHTLCAQVQCQGCMALTFLANNSDTITEQIVAAGGVEVILTGMRAHPSDGQLQNQGCVALRRFANSPAGAEAVKANQGVDVVLAACSTHKDWEIMRSTAKILQNTVADFTEPPGLKLQHPNRAGKTMPTSHE